MGAEDRTEKPTPKRKREARKKGQIPKSPDVSASLILLVGSEIVPMMFRSADKKLTGLFAQANNVIIEPSTAGDLQVLEQGLKDMLAIVMPVVALFAVLGVVANVAQSGLVLNLSGPSPKWHKINPIAGIKRLFSVQSIWGLGKQLAKLLVLVGLAYESVSHMGHVLIGSSPAAMGPIVKYAGSSMLTMVRDVAVLMVLLAIADYAWQRHSTNKKLKMTKQEVKDEARQAEGDPHVKGKVRQKQMRLSRSRMLAAVANADIVIMNPTHYAVALKYEPGVTQAPVVVAKGMDEVALKIKEEGRKHKVPVIEDPPLARALFASCEVEQPIPPELFLAVARLLAFVFSLSPIVKAAGLVHRRATSAMVA